MPVNTSPARRVPHAAAPFLLPCAASLVAVGLAVSAAASGANFESHQVHPLQLTPSGARLLAVNTPDARLEVFTVGATGTLTLEHSVRVGLEPVSVAARTNTEAWVVNFLSDSVSVVDLNLGIVTRTMRVGDEPTDVAFAAGRAFVTVSGEDKIRIFSATDASVAPIDLPIEGDLPRALAVSTDGSTVYAVVLHSGNRTTVLSSDSAAGVDSNLNTARLAALGLNDVDCSSPPPPYPPLPAGITRNPALVDPPSGVPRVGLIVRWNEALSKWEDDAGQDWTPCLPYRMPDDDLFVINATTLSVSTVRHLGTSLFDVSVNPANGKVYVPNTDARNFTRFEHSLGVQGHVVDNQMSIVDMGGGPSVNVIDLNAHVNRSSTPPGNLSERQASISQPGAMAWKPDGSVAYLTAIGSRKLFVMDGTCATGACIFGPTRATPRTVDVSEGPTGVAFHAGSNRVFVLSRFLNRIDIVDPTALSLVSHVDLHDASADIVRAGRRLLYDGIISSAHGDAACSSCHISGDIDRMSWDLGNPEGNLAPYSNVNDNVRFIRPTAGGSEPCDPAMCSTHVGFDPQKGPMTTQTLRAMLEPLHWRGDRATMNEFNPAFVGLLGAEDVGPVNGAPAGLSEADMETFRQFSLAIRMPPNPNRNLDDSLQNADVPIPGTAHVGNPTTGLTLFDTHLSDRGTTCVACHNHPFGTQSGRLGGVTPEEPTSMDAAALTSGNPLHSEHNDLKIPHLRNIYQKHGPTFGTGGSTPDAKTGFGLTHDGSAPDVLTFLCAGNFDLAPDNEAQEVRDIASLLVRWPTGTNPCTGRNLTVPAGAAPTGSAEDEDLLAGLIPLSDAADPDRQCELVVHVVIGGRVRGYRLVGGFWQPDDIDDPVLTSAQLRTTAESPLTYLAVLPGEGARIGNDRDEDGALDSDDCMPDSALPCADADGDGILDAEDNCPAVPNALQEDVDGDLVGDACDSCPTVANPDQENSDTDSLGDACDNCDAVDNLDQANSDGDPAGDACDNCPAIDNATQANSDGDSLGDDCDNCPLADNTGQLNSDGDPLGDACDNCVLVDNAGQLNSDGDPLGDACDNCVLVDNPAQVNSDTDPLGDACDNCDTVNNPAQVNSDTDPVGDACDNCVLVGNPLQTNSDGDPLGDDCDNCALVINPAQLNSDGDALGDACDNCVAVDNASQANSDADALGDACDNCVAVDNASQANSDADALGDACDNCAAVDNADQANSDTDALGDACDNCVLVDNPGQANADSDALGDACDNCVDVGNPTQVNSDLDALGDDCDNCVTVDNPTQLNSDLDALGDACDNCPLDDNPAQANSDFDALGDACDNCAFVTNQPQLNSDTDTHGDACDVCPLVDDEAQLNSDLDTHGDACDNCPLDSNETQANSDTDAFGDACDVCPDVDDPLQLDSDGNGVGDACEPGLTCPEPSALDLSPGVAALRVTKGPSGAVSLAWEDVGAATHEVLGGPIARWRAPSPVHDSLACDIVGPAAVVTPLVDTQYLLVVSRCGALTSSAGRDSSAAERPTAATACP